MREWDTSALLNIALTADDLRVNRAATQLLLRLIESGYDEAVVEEVDLRSLERTLAVDDSEINTVGTGILLLLIDNGHGETVVDTVELQLIKDLLFSEDPETSSLAGLVLLALTEEGLGEAVEEEVGLDHLYEILFSEVWTETKVTVGNTLIAFVNEGQARAVANSIDTVEFRELIATDEYPASEVAGRILESLLSSHDRLAIESAIRTVADLSEKYPHRIPELIDIGLLEDIIRSEEISDTSVQAVQILATLAETELAGAIVDGIDLRVFDHVLSLYDSQRISSHEQAAIGSLRVLRTLSSSDYADAVVEHVNVGRFGRLLTANNEEVRRLARDTIEVLLDSGYGRTVAETIEYSYGSGEEEVYSESVQARQSRAVAPGANLSAANLSGRVLVESHLEYADLSNANLSDAELSGSDLSGANLSQADLSGVDLSRADLSGVNFSRADLSDASFRNANLTNANFTEAKLVGTNFSGSTLRNVEFSNAVVDEVEFAGVDEIELIESTLTSSDELTRGVGVDAAAVLIEDRPSDGSQLLDSLITTFSEVEVPSVQATIIRSIAKIGVETDIPLSIYDETFAEYLKADDEFVRETAANNLSSLIIENANIFPETLAAYRRGLTDSNNQVRLAASKTLAVVVHDYPESFADLEELSSELAELKEVPDLPTEEIEKAVRIVQRAMGGEAAQAG